VELLLAEPTLVSRVAAVVDVEIIEHSGLRRILHEMYVLEGSGQIADVDAVRDRLSDRHDLADAVLRLHDVGQYMQDREEWLGRILNRFAERRLEAEQKAVREQLASAVDDDAATVELLRRLQNRGAKV
jgi:DNA primase